MKKTPLAILLGVLIILLGGTDFILNNPKNTLSGEEGGVLASPDDHPNFTQKIIESDPDFLDYKIEKRNRTSQLFEKFDLSGLKDIRLYRNELVKGGKSSVILYELQGPKNQGGVTYLNLKLALRDQVDATENLNESNEFGQNSFYFNDLNSPDTAFLLTQVGDHLFGYEFNRKNTEDFETVKKMIQSLITNL